LQSMVELLTASHERNGSCRKHWLGQHV